MITKFIQLGYFIAWNIQLLVWFVFRPDVYGVYVAVWYDDRILIIRNSYKRSLTVPCGRVKQNENKKAAAIRELKEEVNIQASDGQLKLKAEYARKHEFKNDFVTFYEMALSELPDVKVDNREVISAAFLSPHQALQQDLSPFVELYLRDYI